MCIYELETSLYRAYSLWLFETFSNMEAHIGRTLTDYLKAAIKFHTTIYMIPF